MTAYLEQFGTTTLPPALPESDAGTGGSTLQLTPLPWGGQFDGLGSGVAPMPGDKLTRKGRLIGLSTSNLDGLYKTYRLLRGTRAKLYRRNGDTTQHWCWARLIEVKAKWNYENIVHMDLDFEFQMLSPYWYSVTTHNSAGGVSPTGPADLATVLAESGSTLVHCSHSGNIDQPAVVFEITTTAFASMVVVNNTTTGYAFTYTNTINPGAVLAIDTGAMSVVNNGADDYASFTPPANHEEWMHMAPGDNVIVITIVGGGSFTISYHAAFA